MNPFTKPEGLTEAGSLAFDIITHFLEEKKLTDTKLKAGDHGIFYSPEEWVGGGGEEDGSGCVLVVWHKVGNHALTFDWTLNGHGLREELRALLVSHGLYSENYNTEHSVVYHRPTSEQLATY